MKTYHRILTIAGSDSGGGAGIQADIKAISACGGYAASAITATTAQNTQGVTDIHGIPVAHLKAQLHAVLGDIGADAVKIGMLHAPEVIEAVASIIREYGITNVVLDPVMVATSGDRLLQEEAVEALKHTLIPVARIITPNLPEAGILLGEPAPEAANELPSYAEDLAHKYQTSVLLKGGHLKGEEMHDVLYDYEKGERLVLATKRIQTKNTHGTGCTLSSALATYLGKGEGLLPACQHAQHYLAGAIASGAEYQLGQGHGPVNHFYRR